MLSRIVFALSLMALPFIAWYGFADDEQSSSKPATGDNLAVATFAGGCFWCMEPPFDKLDGVVSTISGYAGGHVVNPTYKQVTSGRTGHTEAVQVTYDSSKVSYAKLLEVFWVNIDPTDPTGQFCDKGSQYRSEIFYHNDTQKRDAEASLAKLNETKPFKQSVVTNITKFTNFYAAEDYHQDYYQRNPIRYKWYRSGCGRDNRLEDLWGE